MKKIWNMIAEKLEKDFPEDYMLWFSQLTYENSTKDNNITLSVNHSITQTNIKDRFIKHIESAAMYILGYKPNIKIIVKNTIPDSESNNLFFEQKKNNEVSTKPKEKKIYSSLNIDLSQLNPKFTFERFIPGSNSDLAYKAAQLIVQTDNGIYERFNPFFIYGGVGLGKTHLLQAMGNYIKQNFAHLQIIYVTAEKYMNDYIEASISKTFKKFRDFYRQADLLLIDDIQFLENREKLQDEIFNNFNYLYQTNKQIVFTCDKHPKDLKNVQERLISRFSWGLSVDIKPPDITTRKNILLKKLQEIGILKQVKEDVVNFLSENITQNIRDIESAIIKIHSLILLTNTKITIPSLQDQLKDLLTQSKVKTLGVNALDIQEIVCKYYSTEVKPITVSDIRSKTRVNFIVFARHMAIYTTKKILSHLSLSEIGSEFGNREHSTILSSIKKIEKEMQITTSVRHDYEEILKLLTQYKQSNLIA